MQTCTWPTSAALASKKHLTILSKAIRRMSRYTVLSKWTHLMLDRALLMRHKNANLHLTEKRSTGIEKAAQNPEQSNEADENNITHLRLDRVRHKDANPRSASKKQLRILSKAIRRMSRYLFIENRSTYLRLDRALLMRHTRMQTCTLSRSAALASKKQLRTEQSNQADVYSCIENKIDTFKGTAGVPQGCKPAVDQEVRRWLPQSSSVSARCHGMCSADASQGCKPAIGQEVQRWLLKAAQFPEQSNQPNVTICLFIEKKRHI